jgi:hypothetical protein
MDILTSSSQVRILVVEDCSKMAALVSDCVRPAMSQ